MLGPLLEVAMSKKCTPLWREAHFEVNMYKTHDSRTTFGSWDVEKVHAVVARSSDHFVRRCGAKHISKSKVLKTYGLGALLEVDMSKKCTPLWCEAHFEVKMLKTPHVRTTFGRSDVVSHCRRKRLCKTWQAQYFRQVEWKNRKTHWHEAVSSSFNFPFFKEVSQNCCVFDIVKFKFEEVSQTCFVLDVVKFKNQEVSQHCFVFDVVKFKHWGSLAE